MKRLEAARKQDQNRQRQNHHQQDHHGHHQQDHRVHHQQDHHAQHQQDHHVQHVQHQQDQHHVQNHHNTYGNREDVHHDQHQQRQDDHLSSFIDLDFEHFVPGQVEDIEPPKPVKTRTRTRTRDKTTITSLHPHLNNHPSNFSVLVSGLHKNPNPKELAKLFKEGSVDEDKHQAFITSNNVHTPNGFGKVTLPFLDPNEAAQKSVDDLPPVFIAPVGYRVPQGYKGHPLPYDPTIGDRLDREKVNLIHSTTKPIRPLKVVSTTPTPNTHHFEVLEEQESLVTVTTNPFTSRYPSPQSPTSSSSQTKNIQPIVEPEQEVRPALKVKNHRQKAVEDPPEPPTQEVSSPTSLDSIRLKLARTRNRGALVSLYKNREHHQDSAPAAPITIVRDFGSGRKRKRILTKIVRKPYNPETTTTAATQKLSDDDVHTVVRIVGGGTSGGSNPENNNVKKTEGESEDITEAASTVTTTSPVDEEQITDERTEDPEAITTPESYVTVSNTVEQLRFEPTTTYYDAEPSDQILFVTSPKPLAPLNFITRKPRISTTTWPTTTTNTPFTTTTPAPITTVRSLAETEETAAVFNFHPTPFSKDPFKRLHSRFKKPKPFKVFGGIKVEPTTANKDLDSGTSDVTNVSTGTTKKPYEISSPLLKLRKYGFNQGDKSGRIFGQRIKARQRPSYWANREETYEYYPPTTESSSTTTTTTSDGGTSGSGSGAKENYKRKYRPFFDQLYEQLTGSSTTTPSSNKLPYWARPRSTTTSNPYTINAEIFEVYPGSRYGSKNDGSLTTEHYSYDEEDYNDYDYNNSGLAQPKVDDVKDVEYVDQDYTTEHETADKHSTTEHYYDNNYNNEFNTHLPDLAENFIEPLHFVDKDVNLDFGESQHISDNTWNNEVVVPPPRGLDNYNKDIKPSEDLAKDHDKNYQEPVDVYNEHSQQPKLEGDFIPFLDDRRHGGAKKSKLPYVEIQREPASPPLSITIEKVPTDDNDLIKSVLQEVYKTPNLDSNTNNNENAGGANKELLDDQSEQQGITTTEDYYSADNVEEESTTSFLFITPPATKQQPSEVESTGRETTDLPNTTLVKEENIEALPTLIDVIEDVIDEVVQTTESETKVTEIERDDTTTYDEPEPTAEINLSVDEAFDEEQEEEEEDGEAYDDIFTEEPVSTTDALEVTTFRPRGGFLNSLSDFISKFLPSRSTTTPRVEETTIFIEPTTTTIAPTTVTTTTTITTTTTTTAKALEPETGILDAEITREVSKATTTTTKEDITEITTTTEADDDDYEDHTEYLITTTRYPLRIHRPKSYPGPTARDDYRHLESVRHRIHITTTVSPTTIEDTTILNTTEENDDNNSISKDVFGALRREEYFKNWVARKYRKPEDAKSKYSLVNDDLNSLTTVTTTTENTPITTTSTSTSSSNITEAVTESNVLLPFAPTVLPKGSRYSVDTSSIFKRHKKKISFLEKLKNTARNPYNNNNSKKATATTTTDHLQDTISINSSTKNKLKKPRQPIKSSSNPTTKTTTTTTTTTTKKPILYPRGSKLNLFKQWGNSQLSQAEFEKTVLGVSTATEVTVQSRICVRGHCFNADDKAAASRSFRNNQF